MLKYLVAAALALSTAASAHAAPQNPWTDGLQLAQSEGVNSQSGHQDRRTKPRPPRYVCVLDNGGSCPASPGRVGGRCRCPNQTGGGQLTSY